MAATTNLVDDARLPLDAPQRFQSWRNAAVTSTAVLAALVAAANFVPPQAQVSQAVNPQTATTAWTDFASTGPTHADARVDAGEREQRVLTDFIARRFRVARDAVGGFVAAAFRAGSEHRVDPLLVLAVVAVESRFNPVAESALGAKGLMQVLPRYHQDKLAEHGGDAALLDPRLNIEIGTRILREYLRRAGDLESGLQMYGGAADEPSAQYAGKVLLERARLDQLLGRLRRPDA